jgi:hypothetical protein
VKIVAKIETAAMVDRELITLLMVFEGVVLISLILH